jgi:hypothetical protein
MKISAFYQGLSPIFFLVSLAGGLHWRESLDQQTKTYRVWIKYASLQTLYSLCVVSLKIALVAHLALKSITVILFVPLLLNITMRNRL